MPTDATQWLGWVATTLTVGSYFCRSQLALRRVQAIAAVLWAGYGIAISARPIITTNLIVAAVATWSTLRGRGRDDTGLPPSPAVAKDA
jgi:hypothetical protein